MVSLCIAAEPGDFMLRGEHTRLACSTCGRFRWKSEWIALGLALKDPLLNSAVGESELSDRGSQREDGRSSFSRFQL